MTLTKIEWATRSDWNPVRGCTRVTEACRHCYAEIMAARFSKPGQWGHGFAHMVETPQGMDHRWTGKVELQEDRITLPLRWKKPARIFVNSTSDIFHESLTDADIDKLFAVMALASHHTFMILTKRPERMRAYFMGRDAMIRVNHLLNEMKPSPLWNGNVYQAWQEIGKFGFLPNIWLGVSVHDQASADDFIPVLLATPAAIHFASYEPALGPINWRRINIGFTGAVFLDALSGNSWDDLGHRGDCNRLRLIIAGGESGPGARPPHPDWFRQTNDDCTETDTAFFFKQWGEWTPLIDREVEDPDWRRPEYGRAEYQPHKFRIINLAGGQGFHGERVHLMKRVGKKAAGNHLYGRQWLELPAGAA